MLNVFFLTVNLKNFEKLINNPTIIIYVFSKIKVSYKKLLDHKFPLGSKKNKKLTSVPIRPLKSCEVKKKNYFVHFSIANSLISYLTTNLNKIE